MAKPIKKPPKAVKIKKKLYGIKKDQLPVPWINVMDNTNNEFLSEQYTKQIPLLKAHEVITPVSCDYKTIQERIQLDNEE